MLGAKDVAFPRLNLLSFYVYLLGAAIALYGMIQGGADAGWTFYTPYSTNTVTKIVPVLLGEEQPAPERFNSENRKVVR
jgi:cytochrome c oxidase subunit 1